MTAVGEPMVLTKGRIIVDGRDIKRTIRFPGCTEHHQAAMDDCVALVTAMADEHGRPSCELDECFAAYRGALWWRLLQTPPPLGVRASCP